ncbi:SEN1 N terminal-domain-containing protein [Kockovaella imperatae]|uniref:SEN1 N terminal-domain-containing protein n=1 Tax=Kockovaella imperatae TaxID=4999 RepID=A0A1Y1UEA3_9TREE|nr:SEN1 N terminal-domain-containing protein [Kockovaella imperatae]ORX36373.1 SEN1 N terminal-domain-containing protein [Kockovaella imperatae]
MSSSGAQGDEHTSHRIQAILDEVISVSSGFPTDEISSVYKFLMSSSGGSASGRHWYCDRVKTELHREAATFLLYIIANKRKDEAAVFMDALEEILRSCEACSRRFSGVRRRFQQRYLSQRTSEAQSRFFTVVDRWEAEFILNEMPQSSQIQGTSKSISLLSQPMLQLLFGQPSLLKVEAVGALVASERLPKDKLSGLASLGITPVLVHLLCSSSPETRSWAGTCLALTSQHPLSLDDWKGTAIAEEIQKLIDDKPDASTDMGWTALLDILRSGSLSRNALREGLLSSPSSLSSGDSFLRTLSKRLAQASALLPKLDVLKMLLQLCPAKDLWSNDLSLPSILFSDITPNNAFRQLLTTFRAAGDVDANSAANGKGKAREVEETTVGPLAWIPDFVLSLLALQRNVNDKDHSAAFSELLPKVAAFCFQDLQAAKYEINVRSLAARTGIKMLIDLERRLGRDDENSERSLDRDDESPARKSLRRVLDEQAKFITASAFDGTDQSSETQVVARQLIQICFRYDCKDIIETTLGLAIIVTKEMRRQKQARRAAENGNAIPAPVVASHLHRVKISDRLWSETYQQVNISSPDNLALLFASVAQCAHIDKLDRSGSWGYDALRLGAAVGRDDYRDAKHSINTAIKISRDEFPRLLESVAVSWSDSRQASFWKSDEVCRAGIILLLSPVEDIHNATSNLLQQFFPESDVRSDYFRALLRHNPIASIDGLIQFLDTFVQTGSLTQESCSLSKWLVRCFTDILEVLCGHAGDDGPLLQSSDFINTQSLGQSARRKVHELWDRMCNALCVIFKRTPSWADFYDREFMVDWMRDALIFGRQIADYFRSFEAAASDNTEHASRGPSPAKATRSGTELIQMLQPVLRDLTTWLRLNDKETLYQAFELIRTILGRIEQTNPDLGKAPILENALKELDRFSRRDGKSYDNKALDESQLSELAAMIQPFHLVFDVDDDDTGDTGITPQPGSSSPVVVVEPPLKPPSKDAFAIMMKQSSQGKPAKTSEMAPAKRPEVVEIQDDSDEFGDDDFLEELPEEALQAMERKAAASTGSRTGSVASSSSAAVTKTSSNQSVLRFPTTLGQTPRPLGNQISGPNMTGSRPPAQKLNMHVGSSLAGPPKKSSFKSQFMRDMQAEHKLASAERKRQIGGIVKKVPAASKLGSGLGAYTGARKPVSKPTVDDDTSSDSSQSDDEAGLGALLNKQRDTPKKPGRVLVERRPLKTIQTIQIPSYQDARERQRAEQHAMRQRLKPDLTRLDRYILAWNPEYTGEDAPHPPASMKDLAKLTAVPTTFPAGVNSYQAIMRSLFLQELWAQFKQEKPSAPPIPTEISMRSYEDEFIDIELSVQGRVPEGFFISELNLVILQRPQCKSIIAKVQDFKRRSKDTMFKVRILGSMDQKELHIKSKWFVQKHMSLSTALREFGALQGLPYYGDPLLLDILQARSATMPYLSERDIADAQKTYNLNEPQARAVLGALDVNGLALIQGPPGTGKTKTISGLVGKWMSERPALISTDPGERKPPKSKLLICAPSNAAIDEVCKRLIDGVPGPNGRRHQPNVVRIGIDTSVNMAIKDVSLDSLVEKQVTASTAANGGGGTEYGRLQAELEAVKVFLQQIQKKVDIAPENEKKALENEKHALMHQRTTLGHQLSRAKDAARDATRHLEGARRAARDDILSKADIICSTLSGAGHDSLAPYAFETVIIDEAAQAIELSCLIPLRYGCKRCIMVGDPNQLPPTTISQDVEKFHYNESLFVRMVKQSSKNVQLLSIQYRMHPFISELPSRVFYDGKLQDGPNMAKKTAAVWHERNVYGPYRFFNVEGDEIRVGTSTKNTAEALAAVDLYRGLEESFGSKINLALRIGVITMYREQLNEMKSKFRIAYGGDIEQKIEFNTVDGFQGQEKDIIILSCVRSGASLPSIGFLKDPRRMNVALTRAKSSLFILGNGATLERSDQRWNTIISDARDRGFFVNYTSATFAPAPAPALHTNVSGTRKEKTKLKRTASDMSLDDSPDKEVSSMSNVYRKVSKRKSPAPSPVKSESSSMRPPAGLSPAKRKSSSESISNKKNRDPKPAKSHSSDFEGRDKASDVAQPVKSAPLINATPKAVPIPRPPPPRPFPQAPTMAKPRPPEETMFIKKKKKPRPS